MHRRHCFVASGDRDLLAPLRSEYIVFLSRFGGAGEEMGTGSARN
jgi:hypothetical protein